MSDSELYSSFGGALIPIDVAKAAYGSAVTEEIWDFGWLDPARRTAEQATAAAACDARMPAFAITGHKSDDPKKVLLTDVTRACNGGTHFLTFRQETGSCVGNGLGQALRVTAACDAMMRGEPEDGAKLPYWLLAYGWSRKIAGMRGKGEGSFGGAAAEAAREKGFPAFDFVGLPRPNTDDGLCYGKRVEYDWSFGPEQPRGGWDGAAVKHLVRTTAKCGSADDVREAIRNGYACTCASSWGGQMRPQVTDGVLLNRRTTTWAHQMSINGWWDHPSLGEIFYILNSWGPGTHGTCPSGAQPGGFWVKKADIDWICRDEVYALSQWDGFPAQDVGLWLI